MENVYALIDCLGFPIGNTFFVKEFSFIGLDSMKPSTFHVELPYAYSHLPKLDQRRANYSTNVYHGLGFANIPGDEEYSAAIIKLKDFFASVLQAHPSAVIGYPPKNYHAKTVLDTA